MEPIHLRIFTPEGPLADVPVRSVSLPGAKGPFTVLPGHAPLLSPLEKGRIVYVTDDGAEQVQEISSGFAEVVADTVDICAER